MAKTATATTEQRAEVLGGVVPYLSVNGATKAAEFYGRAFGAREVARHPVDQQGRTMHIHLHINGASLMLSDAFFRSTAIRIRRLRRSTCCCRSPMSTSGGSVPWTREPKWSCRCR